MGLIAPVLFVIATWWLATAAVLFGTLRSTGKSTPSVTVAVLALGAGLLTIAATRDGATSGAACAAFLGAVLVWAFHEMTFLSGHIAGPKTQPCPDGVTGWRRFLLGVQTCLWHELAIMATVPVIAILVWNGPNHIALWTFVILWLMRWSAKLNIFFGVRNLHTEFWPDHLGYLKSYVRECPMNGLFPWSIGIGAAVAAMFITDSAAADAPLERTGYALLGTLAFLATLEHLFLMLPVDDGRLWRVAASTRAVPAESSAQASPAGTALLQAKGDG